MVRKKSRKWSKPERHFVFWITYAVLLLGAIGFGGLAGLLFGYAIDLPRVEELQQIQPSVVSSVYDSNGEVIGQFAAEKRILVSYGQVPQRMRNAVIAAEDAGFFTHPGIDFRRLIATVINDVLHWELKGGSTLTMQISKMRFTSEEKTFERKIKDILYAINIEKTYSKEQIFTFYANQISMGHGRYGIAAAADFYFHKTLDELTLAECALLAGIIQAPGRHSPINRPERALARRIFVLGQMLDKSFITEVEYREALDEPLTVKGRDDEQSPAPYFVEEVRQFLSDEYQTDQIWQEGLMVHTTLDYDMQMAAQRALRKGLTEFDRTRRGWAGPIRNILDDGIKPDEFVGPDWGQLFYKDQLVTGLVLESDADSAQVKL
ncbi:MAG TPA: transglycosylase domain-containing protein, partial [Acidobacteriota bacterium]|nr:transglycosylase domain-containing protein [Acidobacteriota bacterium]